MSFLINFISNNFLNGLVVAAFGIISKVALKYFSNDRWETIKKISLLLCYGLRKHSAWAMARKNGKRPGKRLLNY